MLTDAQTHAESADAWQERAERAEELLREADALLGILMQTPAGLYLEVRDGKTRDVCRGLASAIQTLRGKVVEHGQGID